MPSMGIRVENSLGILKRNSNKFPQEFLNRTFTEFIRGNILAFIWNSISELHEKFLLRILWAFRKNSETDIYGIFQFEVYILKIFEYTVPPDSSWSRPLGQVKLGQGVIPRYRVRIPSVGHQIHNSEFHKNSQRITQEFLWNSRNSFSEKEAIIPSQRILTGIPYGFHPEEYGAGLRRLFFRVNSYRIPVWKNEFQWNSGLEVLKISLLEFLQNSKWDSVWTPYGRI